MLKLNETDVMQDYVDQLRTKKRVRKPTPLLRGLLETGEISFMQFDYMMQHTAPDEGAYTVEYVDENSEV